MGISMPQSGLEDHVIIAWLRVTCLDVNVCALTYLTCDELVCAMTMT